MGSTTARHFGAMAAFAVGILASAPSFAREIPVPIAKPGTDAKPIAIAPVEISAATFAGSLRLPAIAVAVEPAQLAAAPNPAPARVTTSVAKPEIVSESRWLYCVEFARRLSGIAIRGDAKTWWDSAKGLYREFAAPVTGAVMVFAASGKMRRGHVAVVKQIMSPREVIVDHANWLNDGRIYLNAPVMDMSKDNDWSLVRVWNTKLGQWGAKLYPLRGFVGS